MARIIRKMHVPAYAAGDKGVQAAAKSGVWWELVKLIVIELEEWFRPPMVSIDAMNEESWAGEEKELSKLRWKWNTALGMSTFLLSNWSWS